MIERILQSQIHQLLIQNGLDEINSCWPEVTFNISDGIGVSIVTNQLNEYIQKIPK